MAAVAAVLLFGLAWFCRFNDPGGSFAGMTDDHFFYVVRGWQMLFGDLPVRDFVDHGAPLTSAVAAAVQWIGGRGSLSEIVFTTTVLAAAVAGTYALGAQASGSIVLGSAIAIVQIAMEPRYYNYPKLLVYVAAIAALWRCADRPTVGRQFLLALATAAAFLFRHDHGVFVAVMAATLFLVNSGWRWRDRVRYLVVHAVLVLVLLTPYLLFLQQNGGVVDYFTQAAEWAERDRGRAPRVWPGLFDNPDGISEAARDAQGPARWRAVVVDNKVAWTFYAELAVPILGLLVLLLSRDAFRPNWPHAKAKLGAVCVLGLLLDIGFLRSPLAARLADPSVPILIVSAWLLSAAARALLRGGAGLQPRAAGLAPVAIAAIVVAGCLPAVVLGAVTSSTAYGTLARASFTDGVGKAFERTGYIARVLRDAWPIAATGTEGEAGSLRLARYVRACTSPGERVFVQGYFPQVVALAERAFAGGHADLRPGFFPGDSQQRLTVERLRAAQPPMIILDGGSEVENFRISFPIIAAYLAEDYQSAGERMLDDRLAFHLLVPKARTPAGTYAPLDWPCFVPTE